MEKTNILLSDALGLHRREMAAFVGGGGKTTLMFSLAHELAAAGKRVITGPSTRILMPSKQDTPLVMLKEEKTAFKQEVLNALLMLGHVTVGQCLLASNKIEGFEKEFFPEMYQEEGVDYILVEADGAKGRSLKAPREHEPVLPEGTGMVVGMMGLDALGQPLDESIVFQLRRFSLITGLQPQDIITEETYFALACHQNGLFRNTPPDASRVIFLNKVDSIKHPFHAEQVVDALIGLPFPVRLVWGSLLPGVRVSVRTLENE
jgi:probable selenium-dependent hydroxylase accessory protein YqeC